MELKLINDFNLVTSNTRELLSLPSGGVEGKTVMLLCRITGIYRRIAKQIQRRKVLEIGCSTGLCTKVLFKNDNQVIATDLGKEILEEAKKNNASFPQCFFLVDALLDFKTLLDLIKQIFHLEASEEEEEEALVVFIDIGGDRNKRAVVELVQLLTEYFPRLLLVVKCRKLYDEFYEETSFKDAPRTISDIGKQFGTGALSNWRTQLHPLRHPLRLNPKDQSQPICRFYNFDSCKRGDACPFDHSFCHLCLVQGHRGAECVGRVE